MRVSKELAQKIVNSMKEIILQDINFIDLEGIIIASTDSSRIGTYHDAGKIVTETNTTIVVQSDEEYKGTRKGVNMPVSVNGKVIAAIGITGSVEQVLSYAQIIQKMTEILVLEEDLQRLQKTKQEEQTMMVDDLLFAPTQFLAKWGEKNYTNWFNTQEKIVAIVKPTNQLYANLTALHDSIFEDLHSTFGEHPDILTAVKDQHIVCVYKKHQSAKVTRIFTWILKEHRTSPTPLRISIGSLTKDNFKQSYEDAQLALDTVVYEKDDTLPEPRGIIEYDSLTIELLLAPSTINRQIQFTKKILGPLTEKEKIEFHKIVSYFALFNGSITKISEALFIHKNTLQYKIQKLKHLTGYDLRNYKDFMLLSLAFQIQHNMV